MKRPIFMILLAFVLGEMITVLHIRIWWVFFTIPIGFMLKIITKKHDIQCRISFFVMIFFFILLGYLLSHNAIRKRDEIYALKEGSIEIQGRVLKITQNRYGWNVFLEQNKILITSKQEITCRPGNVIRVRGVLKHFEQARNEGNFDAKQYYMTLGIFAKVEASQITITDHHIDSLRNFLGELREKFCKKFTEMCSVEYHGVKDIFDGKSGIFSAMILGEKGELEAEIKDLYSASGIAHILAISGLHISFVGMIVYSLLRKRFRFGVSCAVSIVLVTAFGMMCGLGIATIRAMVMFGLKLIGEAFGRRYDYLTAISFAGLCLIVRNPFVFYHAGFQMSFVATIAIVFVYPMVVKICIPNTCREEPKNTALKKDEKREMRREKIKEAFIFSITIHITMNPLVAYHYFQLPTYSWLLNIIIVPLMSVVMVSGILSLAVSFANISCSQILIFPGCIILNTFEKMCEWSRRLPLSNVIVGQPSIVKIILYYGCLFAGIIFILLLKKKHEMRQREEAIQSVQGRKILLPAMHRQKKRAKRKWKIGILALFIIASLIIYIDLPKGFQVTFIDVGQGDGIFIRSDNGTNILIDGGSTSVQQVGKYRIIPFLKSIGVKKVNYAFMTHADTDHISGLKEMIEQSDRGDIVIENLVLPFVYEKSAAVNDKAYQEMEKLAKAHGVKVIYVSEGSQLKEGETILECVHPSEKIETDNRNDYSTVLSLTYGIISVLLTGDISSEQEKNVIAGLERTHMWKKERYTFLKVAHHGSNYSSDIDFLKRVHPRYGIISVGEHNLYGHPGKKTLERLRQSGCEILRTDICGGITITVKNKKILVKRMISSLN